MLKECCSLFDIVVDIDCHKVKHAGQGDVKNLMGLQLFFYQRIFSSIEKIVSNRFYVAFYSDILRFPDPSNAI